MTQQDRQSLINETRRGTLNTPSVCNAVIVLETAASRVDASFAQARSIVADFISNVPRLGGDDALRPESVSAIRDALAALVGAVDVASNAIVGILQANATALRNAGERTVATIGDTRPLATKAAGPLSTSTGHPGMRGAHHEVSVFGDDTGSYVVRTPRLAAADRRSRPLLDVATWPEAALLAAIGPHLPFVPQLVHVGEESATYRYIDGAHPEAGTAALAGAMGRAMGEVAALDAVILAELPQLGGRAGITSCGGSSAALAIVDRAEAVWVYRFRRYCTLYVELGFPDQPFAGLRPRVATLAPRQNTLVHNDLNRENILLTSSGVALLDWELASLGNPLSDVAGHLVKMERAEGLGYSSSAEQSLVAAWASRAGVDMTRTLGAEIEVLRLLHRTRWTVSRVGGVADRLSEAVRDDRDPDQVLANELAHVTYVVNQTRERAWSMPPSLTETAVAEALLRFVKSHKG